MTVLWLAALVCCLLLADKLMRRDDSERKYSAFFEDQLGFDVLFMGTSRVLDAVQPLEMWRDHGFTSYNMGNNSEPLEMTYQVFKLAIGVHKPKVAMVDVFYMTHALDEAWTYPYRHLFLDAVPFGKAKIEAVKAAFPESEWQEFLVPFSLYHGRWDEILSGKTERMIGSESYMMGSELHVGSMERRDYEFTTEAQTEELPGMKGLRDMAALCRAEGIELVLVALPGHASEEEQMVMNSGGWLAEELGVPFLNMQHIGVIDNQTDCFDWQGHLNPSGATKVTAYLGEWLSQHYSLEDHRGDAKYAYWDENLKKYEARRAEIWPE